MIHLTKRHFGKGRPVMLMSGAVSDGHWALALHRVKNREVFKSEDLVRAALGVEDVRTVTSTLQSVAIPNGWVASPGEPALEWTRTAWLYETGGGKQKRVYRCKDQIAALPEDGLVVGEEPWTLYSSSPLAPFRDTEKVEEATFIVMPYKLTPEDGTVTWPSPPGEPA